LGQKKIRMFKAWWNIRMLAAESQQVMWLRFMRLAAGGRTASAEAQRMVSEKLAIAVPAAAGILMGDSPDKVGSAIAGKFAPTSAACRNEGAHEDSAPGGST
jgi:hypothetical protein